MIHLRLLLLSVFYLVSYTIVAAQTTSTAANVKSKKAILPKLSSRFGNIKDSATVTVDELKKNISQPLTVWDDKGNQLFVSNFQIAYKRQIVSEDEATGKQFPSTQLVTALFTSPTLSPIWIKIIKSDLLPNEELLFFDIVVKDRKGLGYYAPDLRVRIK